VLVTSGPTRAYIDRVRFISNVSTGRLGALVACEFAKRGAEVIFVYGEGSQVPEGREIECIRIGQVNELPDVLERLLRQRKIDAVVHAMAVLDYVPESKAEGKISSGGQLTLKLVPFPKLINRFKELDRDLFLVAFKLEVGLDEESLRKRALKLIKDAGADLVVANDLEKITPTKHEAIFIDKNGEIIQRAGTKEEIARKIADIVMEGGGR